MLLPISHEQGHDWLTLVVKGRLSVSTDWEEELGTVCITIKDKGPEPIAEWVNENIHRITSCDASEVIWEVFDEDPNMKFAEEQVLLRLANFAPGAIVVNWMFMGGHYIDAFSTYKSNVELPHLCDVVDLLKELRQPAEDGKWLVMHIRNPRNRFNPRQEAD